MASLSEFTNKRKFQNLILDIDRDITSIGSYNMQINRHEIQLSGGNIKQSPARLNTGVTPLDKLANKLGDGADIFKNKVTDVKDGLSQSLGLNRPGVQNLGINGVLDPSNKAVKLVDYLPPTTIALDAFDKMGKDIDEWIKDSLAIQTFPFKGTEMLCTSLCLIMSLLPCKVTNDIVDGIEEIKEVQYAIKSGLNSAIAAEKAALSSLNCGFSGGISGLANVGDVKKSLKDIFHADKSGTNKQDLAQNIKAITSQIATVLQVVNTVINVAKLGYTDPNAVLAFLVNGMFDLLENVLLALQAIAVQTADKILNKVIKPVEDLFKKNTFPEFCGISAQIIFRKILDIIYKFKNKILQFIADLFNFQRTARKKFSLFNKNALWTLELSVFIKALNLILGNFLDIAISCGPTKRPCPDQTGETLAQSYYSDAVFSEDYSYYNPPSKRATVLENLPEDVALNEIAKKLEPLVNSMFPGSTSKVYPGYVKNELKKVPPLISYILRDIDLGANASLFVDGENATIIYNNPSLCGAN